MTAGQYNHRAGMWLVISLLTLRHAFRDSISDGWMAVSSFIFLFAVLALLVGQIVTDRSARRATTRR